MTLSEVRAEQAKARDVKVAAEERWKSLIDLETALVAQDTEKIRKAEGRLLLATAEFRRSLGLSG